MAKRATGVGRGKHGHPHKTKKRLEIKQAMLISLAKKHHKHNRVVKKYRMVVKKS